MDKLDQLLEFAKEQGWSETALEALHDYLYDKPDKIMEIFRYLKKKRLEVREGKNQMEQSPFFDIIPPVEETFSTQDFEDPKNLGELLIEHPNGVKIYLTKEQK